MPQMIGKGVTKKKAGKTGYNYSNANGQVTRLIRDNSAQFNIDLNSYYQI